MQASRSGVEFDASLKPHFPAVILNNKGGAVKSGLGETSVQVASETPRRLELANS